MNIINITYRDQSENKYTLFRAEEESSKTIYLLPAMGVRASYYEEIATQLAKENYNVITADWRGIGHSTVRPSRKVDFGYEELILDVSELIEHAELALESDSIIILGHSLGGQIGSLLTARFSHLVDALVLIASCSVYCENWEGRRKFRLKTLGRLINPLSKIFGYYPGKLVGFAGTEARTVMKDWTYNLFNGKYNLQNTDFDYESALRITEKPIFSITLENDNFAPPAAAKELFNKFDNQSEIKYAHVSQSDSKIDNPSHFKWAKKPNYFVKEISNWEKALSI